MLKLNVFNTKIRIDKILESSERSHHDVTVLTGLSFHKPNRNILQMES